MERVTLAVNDAQAEFVKDVGRALSGMHGDTDKVCDRFTEQHSRQVAQAVLRLMEEVKLVGEKAQQSEVKKMRREAGYF